MHATTEPATVWILDANLGTRVRCKGFRVAGLPPEAEGVELVVHLYPGTHPPEYRVTEASTGMGVGGYAWTAEEAVADCDGKISRLPERDGLQGWARLPGIIVEVLAGPNFVPIPEEVEP